MKTRKYTLRQRAVRQERTRERIVDAAMALHEELGPAATTISALAERAGVQRLTVYRHFADEREILQACSAKWFDLHPPPEISGIPDDEPAERTRFVLRALYKYYEETRNMWSSLYRDLDTTPALAEPMSQFEAYLASLCEELSAGWVPARPQRLRATLAHAVRFSTWQSLSRLGLKRKTMADLVCDWIAVSAQ